jgi:hypothetical protein
MPKRSSKKPDPEENWSAADAVRHLTGQDEMDAQKDTQPDNRDVAARHEAARLLGRAGGRKGGPARAEKLSPRRRSAIAKKAARARWGKPKE